MQIQSTKPVLLLGTQTYKDATKKENRGPASLARAAAESPQNTRGRDPEIRFKNAFAAVRWDLLPGCKTHKPTNVTHHVNERKDKNHTILSTDTEKACDKVQHPFVRETLSEAGLEGTFRDTSSLRVKNPQLAPSPRQKRQGLLL